VTRVERNPASKSVVVANSLRRWKLPFRKLEILTSFQVTARRSVKLRAGQHTSANASMHRKKLGEPNSLPAEGMVWMAVMAGQLLLSIMSACLYIS
jgi:hypothetical protein